MLEVPVGGEALEATDADRFPLDAAHADEFTLVFLRTDAPADSGEAVGFNDRLVGAFDFTVHDFLDKVGDLDVHGAAADAGTVFAV